MRTKYSSILLMVVSSLFISFAQLLYKYGINNLSFNFISIISNWQIILGLFSYGIAALFFIAALKGGKVSVLYPIAALSYIWVVLGSKYIYAEPVSFIRWIGIVVIIAGVFVLNLDKYERLEVVV